MTCDEVRGHLAAHLDGEIDGAPRRAMDSHLAGCAACAAERAAQAAAWRLLEAWTPPAAPADLGARVAARARTEPAGPGGGVLRLPLRTWATAAAVLLAAGGAFLLLDGAPEEAPPDLLLGDLDLLESLEFLQGSDAEALDGTADLPVDDLEVLGG
jgi:anti-sigma factor RsiW